MAKATHDAKEKGSKAKPDNGPEKIASMHAAYKSGKEIVDGFLSRPFEEGARNAIVLIHGYRGVDDGQRAVTRRFAKQGFSALSPDLFHEKIYTSKETCAMAKTSLDIAWAVEKIADSVAYLRRLPCVREKKVAVMGFCMGGGLALYALAKSDVFSAGVILTVGATSTGFSTAFGPQLATSAVTRNRRIILWSFISSPPPSPGPRRPSWVVSGCSESR